MRQSVSKRRKRSLDNEDKEVNCAFELEIVDKNDFFLSLRVKITLEFMELHYNVNILL